VPSNLQSGPCTDYANPAPYYEEMLLQFNMSLVKVKTKFNLEQATKTQKWSGPTILLFNLGRRWWWVVNPYPTNVENRVSS